MPTPVAAFAACLPGLEPLLGAELQALGVAAREVPGGAEFDADPATLQRCGLWLGTASHVLVRLATFSCRALGELERKAAAVPFAAWLRDDVPLAVRVTAKKSRLYHTGAIEERVVRAAQAALPKLRLAGPADADGERPAPVAQLAVRMVDDVCTLSLDTTATPLHRRGYRLASAKAPLREDLAHALVLTARLVSHEAFLDPFCGAGTLAIEAAGLRLGLPPGRLRPPPLQHLAAFDAPAWRNLLANVEPQAPGAPIAAGDRDAGAIEAATANAARAGVGAAVQFACVALRAQPWLAGDGQAPSRGALVTNPPFGVRVGQKSDLTPLYQSLGTCVRGLGAGWRAAILAHDPRLARKTGLPLQVAFSTRIGGLPVAALATT